MLKTFAQLELAQGGVLICYTEGLHVTLVGVCETFILLCVHETFTVLRVHEAFTLLCVHETFTFVACVKLSRLLRV